MKYIPFFLLACIGCLFATAQGPYSLANVPDAIKGKASVITHLEDMVIDIESADKANWSVHKIYTVVSDDARPALFFSLHSSKYATLDDVEIKVYNVSGKQVARYKKKDMSTIAFGDGLIDDGYYTYLDISTPSYPVTVEIKYDQKFKGTLFIPSFQVTSRKEAIIEKNFTARVANGLPLRYKSEYLNLEPAISQEGSTKIYKWSVKNQPPAEYEEGASGDGNSYPHVKLALDQFSYYGSRGDLSSWKNFGRWIMELYKGLDALSADRQQFFTNMVKDCATTNDKVKRIYDYLQKNFRYVSIQLGIGGLKPFPAEFTDQKKYGDCKGLSNYMKAALGSVGIRSHVAIINAAYDGLPVDPSFPTGNFNHVILCVPVEKDSIWLECTSSSAEFGQLGTFTENRNALLITEDGGVLVPTPKSTSSSNVMSSRTRIKVAENFTAETETEFTGKGRYRDLLDYLLKEKKDEQKKTIVFGMGFKQPDLFEVSRDKSDQEKVNLKMFINKVHDFNAGPKSFISPRLDKTWAMRLPKAENRKFDYYFQSPFEQYDTTIVTFPEGISPDALPTEKILTCPYASYASKSWYSETEKSVYTATTLILKQHKVGAADYPVVKKFFDDLTQNDSQKIVVRKQEGEKKETEKKAF